MLVLALVAGLITLEASAIATGLVVGTAVGFGAAGVLLLAVNSQLADEMPRAVRYPLSVPWQVLAITTVGVPLIAMLGAGLLTRSRLPIERRLT